MPTNESQTTAGAGGLPKVLLVAADGARAEVYLHGAHVTSWIPADDTERLFLSSRSEFDSSTAIRGGVPIIFPQFANEGPLPKHGFARTAPWEVVAASGPNADAATATFRLRSSPAMMAIWPHAFVAEFVVAVRNRTLDFSLTIENTGEESFTFTAALHTYLRVADARRTFVRGLAGRTYRDSAAGGARRVESAELVAIEEEVNRIYFDVDAPLSVEEPDRVTRVEMDGFRDVVVWNPGPASALTLSDMEPDGYLRMLCIEAAAIGAPIKVSPHARWRGGQRLVAADR